MAREIEAITQSIRTVRMSKAELADLIGPDQAADFALWEDVFGYCILQVELENDILKLEIDTEIDNNSPGSLNWWREKISEFQYDAANPQVVEEINFKAVYPVIDESLRIITRRAVRNVLKDGHLVVSVKVAKTVAGVVMPLNDDEITALTDYTLAVRPAGISMEIISLYPDRLKLIADIYYQGQYGLDLIKTNVIKAINNYLAYLSNNQFDGLVRLLTLQDYIQNVAGVTDIKIDQALARDQASLVGASVPFDRVYYTYAGYIIAEDTAGHTLADTLTFIAESA